MIIIILIVVAGLEKEISDVIHCKIQNIFLTTPSHRARLPALYGILSRFRSENRDCEQIV